MEEIETDSWQDEYCGYTAQRYAIRLSCFCSAVLPSDKKFQELLGEEIVKELLGLAFYGRKTMELRDARQVTIQNDPLWPASKVANPESNLFHAFGTIIHSKKIAVHWEQPDDCNEATGGSNPYKKSGREARFAGSISAISKKDETAKLPIGAIVASYIHFQNQQETIGSKT